MKKILFVESWIKIGCLVFLFSGIFASVSFAQKFGYVNSANILIQVPETAQADKELKDYQDGLVKKGEEMATALKNDFEAFAVVYQEGKMAPAEAQKEQATFQKRQQDIAAYEQEVIGKLEKKREELFKPILDRVQDAINKVGKEGDYTFIFDTSIPGTILHVRESDDVSSKVLAELGL